MTIPARLKKLEGRQARLEEKLDSEIEGIDEDLATLEERVQELERWRGSLPRDVQDDRKK